MKHPLDSQLHKEDWKQLRSSFKLLFLPHQVNADATMFTGNNHFISLINQLNGFGIL
jgi:hypothetical protein